MSNPEVLSHHHILLYRGDFERIAELHNTKKPTTVIRDIVRRHIQAVEARLTKQETKDV